jgi:hypothetical protein
MGLESDAGLKAGASDEDKEPETTAAAPAFAFASGFMFKL